MKNYLKSGKVVTLVMTDAVAAGGGVLFGRLFGVSIGAAASGEQAEISTEGVYTMPKVSSEAYDQGQKLYWDVSAGNMTTVSASPNVHVGVSLVKCVRGTTDVTILLGRF